MNTMQQEMARQHIEDLQRAAETHRVLKAAREAEHGQSSLPHTFRQRVLQLLPRT